MHSVSSNAQFPLPANIVIALSRYSNCLMNLENQSALFHDVDAQFKQNDTHAYLGMVL